MANPERYGESTVDRPEPFTKVPAPVSEKKPGQLSQEQIRQYFEEGFLIVENFLTPDELQPCIDSAAELTDSIARKLYDAGKITNLHADQGPFQRLTMIEKEYPGTSILMFKQGKMTKAFMDLWVNSRILNVMEQLVGPDVSGHPVWNIRIKPPKHDHSVVPWHQDAAYLSEKCYDHLIPTAWIPFLDTDEHNGGMQVVRGGHRFGRVARHVCCPGDTWFVDLTEEEMEKNLGVNMKTDLVTCRVPFGGFLLFNQMIPHRSVSNNSNNVRWSIDLRWQSPHENWGFYDIAEGVHFRSTTNPDVKPDWNKFLSINRKEVWQKRHNKQCVGLQEESDDPFNTVVTGPWIGRWQITHQNRHTEAFKKITAS